METQYYLFVCDSSTSIGTGHVARCINLAKLLSPNSPSSCIFLHRNLTNSSTWQIEKSGFTLKTYDKFEHLYETIKNLGVNAHLLIFDNYHIDQDLEKKCAQLTTKILVIDDLFDRKHACDILLNQNLIKDARTRYAALLSQPTELFLGPSFALLSHEYTTGKTVSLNSEIKKVLVFFGGTDPTKETLKFLAVCSSLKNLKFSIVVGKSCPHAKELVDKSAFLENVEVLIQVDSLLPHLLQADLFIGAGGSVSWERSTTGIPSIVVSVADNQIEMSESLAETGAHEYLGHFSSIQPKDYIDAIESMSFDKRSLLSQKSLDLKVSMNLPNFVHFLKA